MTAFSTIQQKIGIAYLTSTLWKGKARAKHCHSCDRKSAAPAY